MLHKSTVDPATLELLISLQDKHYLRGFHLVGGTALSLWLGHRKSIEVDFSDWPVLLLEPDLTWKKVTSKLEAAVFKKMKKDN